MTSLTSDTIRTLVNRSCEHGVLSVFATVDPGDPRAWRSTLHRDLALVTRQLDTSDHDLARAVVATTERAEREIEDRVGRPEARSVAGFLDVTTNGRADTWIELNMRTTTCAMLTPRPHVAPLVRLLEIAAPAGVLCAAEREAAIHEWDAGVLRRLATFEVSVPTDQWRRMQGPSGGMAGRGYETVVQTDAFERHLHAEQVGRLRELVMPALERFARGHSWGRIVVFGPAQVHGAVGAMAGGVQHIDGGPHRVVHEDAAQLADRVARLLRQHTLLHELELAQEAIDSPATRSALGLRAVFPLVRERRIERLLIADRSEQGDAVSPVVADELIELTVKAGGEVTPVEGEAARLLARHDGIAALLWY